MVIKVNPFQPRWISRIKNDLYCFKQRYKALSRYDKTLDAMLTLASVFNLSFLILGPYLNVSDATNHTVHIFQLSIIPIFALDLFRTAWKIKYPSNFLRYHWFDISVLVLVLGIFSIPVYPRTGRSAYLLRREQLHKVSRFYKFEKVQGIIEIMELKK